VLRAEGAREHSEMGEILMIWSLGFIWIVSASERPFSGQIFIKKNRRKRK